MKRDEVLQLRLVPIDDILIISRDKYASRTINNLFEQTLIDKFDIIHLIKKKVSGEFLGQFSTFVNHLVTTVKIDVFSNCIIHELYEEEYSKLITSIKDSSELSKLNKNNLLEVVEYLNKLHFNIIDSYNKIKEGNHSEDFIVVYRNPKSSILSGIFQDMFNGSLRDLGRTNISLLLSMLSEDTKKIIDYKEYSKTQNPIFNLQQINDDLNDGLVLGQETINIILNYFSYFVELNGLNEYHRGRYLTYIRNIFLNNLGNKKMNLVNLDATGFIDFKKKINELKKKEVFDLNLSENLKREFYTVNKRQSNKELVKLIYNNSNDSNIFFTLKRIEEYISDEVQIYNKLEKIRIKDV